MAATGWTPGSPGWTAKRESSEAGITWQSFFQGDVVFASLPLIDSTAVDGGNTPTSTLRPGLVMAQLDSGAGWVDYDNDATDGSQEARGILGVECNLHDYAAAASADRFNGTIVISGKVQAARCLNLDQQARNQLRLRGMLFDDIESTPPDVSQFRRVVEKAADYTVVAADNGTCFLATTGAVNFTLPTIAVGLRFRFFNTVDANMAILSAGSSDNIICKGDAGADSVTFSTMSQKIGACAEVQAVYLGGALRWLCIVLSDTTATVA